MAERKRVCVIGSGPSGLSFLYQISKRAEEGLNVPEVVCYEMQHDIGGLWIYNWRTGLNEYGEYVHNSMYRYLWSNGPKEASLEYPDYTFDEHFGKPIPSFPPRAVLYDYLTGRVEKNKLRRFIRFGHMVKSVKYNANSDNFSVVVKNLEKDVKLPAETYDYIVNCSGHFSVPNVPQFPGFESFPGRIMHAHDFRDATEFAGKRMLLIGSSYSAEDISMQCVKYGAKSAICSHRKGTMGYKWPKEIEERPLLSKMDGNMAIFKDGSTAEVDDIILCTGYRHHYPHMEDSLRLTGPNILYPDNLYKGTLWTNGGANNVFYIGAQDQYYTFTLFEIQAVWAAHCVVGKITLPKRDVMRKDIDKWIEKNNALKDCHDHIDFQTEFMEDLRKETDYPHMLDVADLFHSWEHDKYRDILTFRDQAFSSIYTKTKSPVHHSTFMEAMDDSMESYMGKK